MLLAADSSTYNALRILRYFLEKRQVAGVEALGLNLRTSGSAHPIGAPALPRRLLHRSLRYDARAESLSEPVDVLELAKQLGNVSQACKRMGYSRDKVVALEKAKTEKEVHGEFESECPAIACPGHFLWRQHERCWPHLSTDLHRYLRQ